MPLLWCVGNSACLFIMSGMEATETKVERTHSLMSQWNFKMNATKTYFSLFWRWLQTHTNTSFRESSGFSSFSQCVLGLFARACYITSAHWQREMDCVGSGWKFGECYNFALSVGLGVCENSLYAVHCVQPHVVLQVLPLHSSHSICFSEKTNKKRLFNNTNWVILNLFPDSSNRLYEN